VGETNKHPSPEEFWALEALSGAEWCFGDDHSGTRTRTVAKAAAEQAMTMASWATDAVFKRHGTVNRKSN
jgi:hypothetical protein